MEVSVTGAQPVAAASEKSLESVAKSVAVALQGAGASVGAGAGSKTAPSSMATADDTDSDAAIRPPPPLPVSSTFCAPSETRVKVNFGKTLSVESNVPPSLIDIDPVEALKSDSPTETLHASEALSV